MKAHRGQIALLLIGVLVAIILFLVVNLNIFLGIRAKNRLMNAVDTAAIAAANHQGKLLNELGRLNRKHLLAALANRQFDEKDAEAMREIVAERPREGVELARAAAANWGAADTKIDPGIVEREDMWSQDPLLNQGFYEAIAAPAWCWFGIGSRSQYLNMNLAAMKPQEGAHANCGNCEYFSLHVTFKTWADTPFYDHYLHGLTAEWTNFVMQVTGCSQAEINGSWLVGDLSEVWAFYDSTWGKWSDYFSPDKDFPIAGHLKDEYDVAGASAQCRIVDYVLNVLTESKSGNADRIEVTAEAKPLGTVRNLEGAEDKVTAFHDFIISSSPTEREIFREAQLVPVGSVPHPDAISTQEDWLEHVEKHLPGCFAYGIGAANGGCFYCRQLIWWENAANRAQVRNWLMTHECRPSGSGGMKKGGYPSAH